MPGSSRSRLARASRAAGIAARPTRGSEAPASDAERVLRWALLAGLAAFAAALGGQRIFAFDYGWHVRAGALILELGDVPRVDTLSLSHEGHRWVDLHWLFQLGVHALRRIGGDAAVVLFKAACAVAIAAVAALRGHFRAHPATATLGAAWALAVACDRFTARPEIVSLLLLGAELALLERFARRTGRAAGTGRQERERETGRGEGDALVYLLVPLHLLWANLHGLFAVGLAIAGIHLVARFAEAAAHRELRDRGLRQLALATVLAALVTLLNPNGSTGALFPLTEQIAMIADEEVRASSRFIGEFIRPFSPRQPLPPLDVAAFAVLAVAGWAAMLANRRRLGAADPLVWGALLYLAVLANRNVALFAVAAGPIAARHLGALLATDPARRSSAPLQAARAALCLLLFACAAAVTRDVVYPHLAHARETGLGLQTHWYPEGAAAWIARERPPGPVANVMRDGGYLLSALPPAYKILTDGRFAGLGNEAEHALQGPADLERLDARHHFGSVVVPYWQARFEPLVRALTRSRAWRAVHVDAASLLFARRDFAELGSHGLDLRRVRIAEPDSSSSRAGAVRQRRAALQLYAALDRPEEALAALDALAEIDPNPTRLGLMRGQLLQRLGRVDEARAEVAALHAAHPEDATVRTAIGNLELRLGDAAAARRHYAAAAALDARTEAPRQRIAALDAIDALEANGDARAAAQALRRLASQPLRPGPPAQTPAWRVRAENAAGPLFGTGLALAVLWRRRLPLQPG